MAEGDFEAEVREALRGAVTLFNEGHFRESHEVLEEVWRRDGSLRRRFLQGIIKVAAGYHHLQNRNFVGMEHLLSAGRQLLLPFGDDYMGVDLDALLPLVEQHAEWARRVQVGKGVAKLPLPPTINLTAAGER